MKPQAKTTHWALRFHLVDLTNNCLVIKLEYNAVTTIIPGFEYMARKPLGFLTAKKAAQYAAKFGCAHRLGVISGDSEIIPCHNFLRTNQHQFSPLNS